MEDATPAQLKWIENMGYNVTDKLYTKRDCSELILMAPATDAQVWRLRKEGYDVSKGVTRGEAEAAFLEIERKKMVIPIESKLPIYGIE